MLQVVTDAPPADEAGQGPAVPKALQVLADYIDAVNIADGLSEEQLNTIGSRCVEEYELDDTTRGDWVDDAEKAMDLARMVVEPKSYPFEGAANVKYPLIATASMQFAARAYPAIVDAPNVAKAQIVGEDADGEKQRRGDRVAEHMSWQLLNEIEEWEEDTDVLLHQVPIVGCAFKKVYYSPGHARPCIEYIPGIDLVVNHDTTRSLMSCPRITHRFDRHPYEVRENQNSGRWRKADLGQAEGGDADSQAPHEFIEQHRFLDLDEDGVDEPYIVTVHVKTKQVMRITANFDREDVKVTGEGRVTRVARKNYFVRYQFLPNPDGGFYGIGFGSLLRSINETVNSTLNQMLDAGHLQNAGGGFIGSNGGIWLKEDEIRQSPGKFHRVRATGDDIRKSIVHMEHPGPSASLFQLLGLMIEAGKEVASVKDVMTGDAPKNTPATTTLALIEQGMMVFTAIYKRIHRALKQELGLLYDINTKTLPPKVYFTVLDTPKAVAQEDYAPGDYDIIPVSDPKLASDMQKITRAQMLLELSSHPWINSQAAVKRFLIDTRFERPEELLVQQAPVDTEQEMKNLQTMGIVRKMEAESMVAITQAIKNIADAEAAEAGPQLQEYKMQLDAIMKGMASNLGAGNGEDQPGRMGTMGSQPDNAGGDAGSSELPSIPGGPVSGGTIEPGTAGPGAARPYARADAVDEAAY